MRRICIPLAILTASACCFAATTSQVLAQEGIAGVGATTSMAGTLGGMGNGAVPSASRVTRGLPPAGVTPGSDANFGADSTGVGGAAGRGTPNFPNASRNGTTTTTSTTTTRAKPLYWTNLRAEDYLAELRGRTTIRNRIGIPRTDEDPYRPLAKYKVPPRNWLGFYLPQDRYKITLNIWRYVSIEDDRRAYPVRYYYRPNSPTMLALLARSPQGVSRFNRVVGFASWQDAMAAGYRPDPVSKPEPAARVLQLSKWSRSPQFMRYVEATYAGQISPESFTDSYTYAQSVARAVNARKDTRSRLPITMAQVFGALLGENAYPRQVKGELVTVQRKVRIRMADPLAPKLPAPNGAPSSAPRGSAIGSASISGDAEVGVRENRVEDYNRFRSNASNLRAR